MWVVPVIADTRLVDRSDLRLEHQFIKNALWLAEAAVYRIGACDVGGIAFDLAAGVDQHQIAVVQRFAVFDIVQDTTVVAASHDRRVRELRRTRHLAVVAENGSELVFVHAGLHAAHQLGMGLRRQARGTAHHRHLGAALVQAHLVQVVIQREKLDRPMHAGARARSHLADPIGHALVQRRVGSHRKKNPFTLFEQTGQDVIQVRDRKRIIGAVLRDGALEPRTVTIPKLFCRILFATEQDVLAVRATRHEHHHRLRFGEPGEVIEIAVRPEPVMHIAIAHRFHTGRQYGHAARAHHAHQLAAAPFELR